MSLIGKTNHAFFFDGVSDGIVVPQGYFSSIGNKNIDSEYDVRDILSHKAKGGVHSVTSGLYSDNIAIEAWLIPDYGGTVVEKYGQFCLKVGEIHKAAPVEFQVSLLNGSKVEKHTISTGEYNGTKYVGAVYPTTETSGILSTNNSNLTKNHRQLLHVVAAFYGKKIEIYVNGVLMAQKILKNPNYKMNIGEENIHIGGGGKFRGVLEGLHINANFRPQMVQSTAPLKNEDTMLLYRFEEPITVFEDVYKTTASASATNTTITISTTDAASLATKLKGKSVTSGTLDFTQSPYSSGNYKILQSTSSGVTKRDVAHVPYNLLLRPGAFDNDTKKPNSLPPERVRLKSINVDTGVLTIASIHLDFDTANDGTRGLLHAHASGINFVVIGADLLIDSGTGKPYQPPHYSSRAIDRTGQMVIDESIYEYHGFVYSNNMSFDTEDTNNPYAITWPTSISTEFSIGHSGRHAFNHVEGHHYLRKYPTANQEVLDLQNDGSADLIKCMYDTPFDGLKDQLNVNSKVDLYKEFGDFEVKRVIDSSEVNVLFNNYHSTGSSANGSREIIAIGGSALNYQPFLLKSPTPSPSVTPNNETRNHHLRPSKESRIALLHVPTLASSHNLSPFVEIHYNAVDLTGLSMSETSQPLLMVEKTVPAGTTTVGSTNVYDVIATAIASGNLTLYAPGGCVYINSSENPNAVGLLGSHLLSNDNSEGYNADLLLDESTTPRNLTPYAGDTLVNTPPKIIQESSTKTTQHDSSFHQMIVNPMKTKKNLGDFSDYQIRDVVETGSGSNSDTPVTSSSSPIFEMFDIIDNVEIQGHDTDIMLIVQPSDRKRSKQLSFMKSAIDTNELSNKVGLHYLLSRARIRSVREIVADEEGSYTSIEAVGLQSSMGTKNISFTGSGSNDSHIIKEIEPNSPVVSVTLGGLGQGAVDTKPTFDKSDNSREPYSVRRAYTVNCVTYDASNKRLYVEPINNESTSLASWATVGFPKSGKLYFENGGYAQYDSKTATYFQFSSATLGDDDFSNGVTEFTEIYKLLQNVGALSGASVTSSTTGNISCNVEVSSEPNFDSTSMIEDGSNVNDRMFHAMSDVSHDYQLDTHYASTRALVEIPFFSNQFFDNEQAGTFVDDENSFKIHLDATHTAHTWNPNPVGRRPKNTSQIDREMVSAYAQAVENGTYITSTRVISWNGSTSITVEDASIFPDETTDTDFRNLSGNATVLRDRRIFTDSGEWVVYTAVNHSTNVITILDPTASNTYSSSENFVEALEDIDANLYVGGKDLEEIVDMIGSDANTPSADFENRSEYYHDQSNITTQGGNVDYGLRQYVSAVEIKAGPESNPHAEKIISKRATGKVRALETVGSSGVNTLIVSLSSEDFVKFPSLGKRSIDDFTVATGEMFYEATIRYSGADYKFHYYGHLEEVQNFDNTSQAAVASNVANSIVLVHYESGSYPTWSNFVNSEVVLTGRKRRIFFDEYVDNASDGVSYFHAEKDPLVAELNANVKFDTNITYASDDGSRTITVNNGTASKSLDDLYNINIRKGDLLFYLDDDGVGTKEIGYIGVVDSVSDGTAISLTATIPNWMVKDAGNTKIGVAVGDYNDQDAILNATWLNPYCNGGMRQGDTVWANMSYSNPHAVEGLFSKSRGVLNEAFVWKGFNGGEGSLHATNPRDSIPMENFLIGDTCLETAKNLAQHINKTVEENYKSLGLTEANAPTVAYIDPYMAKQDHARVLLYDVAHDREYIAFQDLHMQVQTSADTTKIGWNRHVVEGSNATRSDLVKRLPEINGSAPHAWTTQIDVANGYPSQNPFIRPTQQSKFIESAYAHDLANKQTDDLIYSTLYDDSVRKNDFSRLYGKSHGHFVHSGMSITGNADGYAYSFSTPLRNQEATTSWKITNDYHTFTRKRQNGFLDYLSNNIGDAVREKATLFDTPEGTRVIPAFLCLKGIRADSLTLSNHEETRLQHLPQWKDMDFVRRLTISAGEIAESESVVDVQSAALEIVRKINQYGALEARLSNGGSAHDPAVWWDTDKAFANQDSGTHMGYLRAHIGRAVEDREGNQGYTVVIHSTVPGATGRNFCVWLDNSTSQTTYKPQFLVGYGGRWRNFWALPEEKQGENMHPAPMPLDKNGRPFAPITTLRQYIQPNESGEEVKSVAEFGDSNNTDLLSLSDTLSGQNHNSVNTESFDLETSSTIVDGLRKGTKAVGRINFGGLTATGVPGFSPRAGVWGFGKRGNTTYANKYGLTDVNNNDYTSHVSSKLLDEENIGTQNLYGVQLKDHKGNTHGLRYIYSDINTPFANENTVLPDTIENEICIYFDDSSNSKGGFTIGKHMLGSGDATNRLSSSHTNSNWRGNRWNPYPSPNMAIKMGLATSGTKVTATLVAPYTTNEITHPDVLGYLGFPKKNGVFQTTKVASGSTEGDVASYEYRIGNVFYNVTNAPATSDYIVSPTLNWTTLITDELLAAVTAFAINLTDVTDYVTFDCTSMYASDGRTFGAWGITKDAIKIKPYSLNNDNKSLSKYFTASTHTDFGIEAAHLEFGEIRKAETDSDGNWAFGTSRAISSTDIDNGRKIDCGYLPKTILQISTKFVGPNSNTTTPVIVDSNNNPIDTTSWKKNLTGEDYVDVSGDKILPKIENPIVKIDNSATTGWGSSDYRFKTTTDIYHFLRPATTYTSSDASAGHIQPFGESKRIFIRENVFVKAEGYVGDTSSHSLEKTIVYDNRTEYNWPSTEPITHLHLHLEKEFAGLRSIGSVYSEPIVYFKGGKSSPDHSVPLFFGGGFSGVVLDVNDGTQNDYADFYTHPYSNGPTGTTGIQNANEISTSFAMLDCNAIFSFFPGAALCNQHRGSPLPPVFNKDNILSTDLDRGGTTYSTGVTKAKPVPLVLRFPHPTARYEDHTNNVENKTTYLIFGPGQAFPFMNERTQGGGEESTPIQPHPGRVITTGNGWNKVPYNDDRFHNQINNNDTGNSWKAYRPRKKATYLAEAAYHWRAVVNWETPAGYSLARNYAQYGSHGRMFGQMVTDTSSGITYDNRTQPLGYTPFLGYGIAMAADTVFHMDGGFHPGGHWMDDIVSFSPSKDSDGNQVISVTGYSEINPTAFRVAGVMLKNFIDWTTQNTEITLDDVDMEYIVVDATRTQNGEELASVLSSAINAFPGKGALKSIGGTHHPSMGNSMRQDRYGWVDVGNASGTLNSSITNMDDYWVETAETTDRDMLEQLPASGWLRANTTTSPAYACYYMKQVLPGSGSNFKARFYLAPNFVTGSTALRNFAHDDAVATLATNDKLYVWSKTGVIRYNNENASNRNHMTQVHFSGIVDAVDRTKPIGAVGWSGERYSYLNSLKVGTEGYAAGLGAYHSCLNFSPYGSASSVMNVYGSLPLVAPLTDSPESRAIINDGETTVGTRKSYISSPYTSNTLTTASGSLRSYAFTAPNHSTQRSVVPANYAFSYNNTSTNSVMEDSLHHPQGVYSSAFVVVSYESELSMVAKHDRDGVKAFGDWLYAKHGGSTDITDGGTTNWDERFHNQDRFVAPANAGPNVEALIADTTVAPTGTVGSNWLDSVFSPTSGEYTLLHSAVADDTKLENAVPGLNVTGDLLYDLDYSVGSLNLEQSGVERNVSKDYYASNNYSTLASANKFWMGDVNGYQTYSNSSAKNFNVENVVWKRMDGGNLSLPAINARGMGAVPLVTRVKSNTAYLTGEKIYGNVRFSFESTNSVMMPKIDAQELAQSGLPIYNINNVLQIPNEELQFKEATVVDDSGKTHTIEGGSPFGTIIRCFDITRGKPSLANSGNTPNLAVRLPDPNSIPGNIVVRSGFDPIQAYQTETFGSGGMQHPGSNSSRLGELFDSTYSSTQTHPIYEEYGWEHYDTKEEKPIVGGFNNNTLDTSFELHDRMLLFHVCKVGSNNTHRYPTAYTHSGGVVNQSLTLSSFASSTVTASATINTSIFDAGFGSKEEDDNRRYIRIYDDSGNSGLATYTGISGNQFTGVKADADFTTLSASTATKYIVPSYSIPAGSARFYAARRLRDHAEISGNSPDMAHTKYIDGSDNPYVRYSKPIMTPMAYPRMGHHYVNATQPMLPGHWAHPAYLSLYKKHRFEQTMSLKRQDSDILNDAVVTAAHDVPVSSNLSISDKINPFEAEIAFGSLNATPSPPSDIHGGAFTLMFESGVKWDGYGVLASTGYAGDVNKAGGHSIVLAAAGNYTLANHFPDPSEVGAYQIVIQPNLFKGQLGGAIESTSYAFTGQQVNTVIGIKHNETIFGGMTLVLAKATQFDCRGCEIFINEVMLDTSADFGSQFTNIPPLMLYNSYGINLNETPSFTRRNFPYSDKFVKATPHSTKNIPYWSILFGSISGSTELIENSSNYIGISQYAPDNYFVFSKSNYGSIGNTLTMQGHITKYPNIYSSILENNSPIAKCIVTNKGTSGVFTVDNGSSFPSNPQFGQNLYYVAENGKTYSTTYTRSGYLVDKINLKNTITVNSSTEFYSNLFVGAELRLSSNYNTFNANIFSTNKTISMYAKTLESLSLGNTDTNNLYPPDAYLCLWNHNLGRPMTYFSDSRSNWDSVPVDKARYNALPEHFETIHYHNVNYSISLGPFNFMMKSQKQTDGTGSVYAADSDLDCYTTNVLYGGYWPCGSRGGPQASCLDSYVTNSVSWTKPGFAGNLEVKWEDDGWDTSSNTYSTTEGIDTDDVAGRKNFGNRISLKQAYNRPSWGIPPARAALEKVATGSAYNTTSYDAGPIVQIEQHSSLSSKFVGIFERMSNFTGMLNADVQGEQVRYAQGNRMTRPFGVPVRTLRNSAGVERDWWGDVECMGVSDLAVAAKYYLVDWWNNERGEEVRRSPVRAFGIRPAWDCGNAYKETTTTPFNRIWNSGSPLYNVKGVLNSSGQVSVSSGYTTPRYGGVLNNHNNNSSSTLVDVFAPVHSLRVGDMGNGRGVRHPTWFNQCIYTDVSNVVESTGLVLSRHTNEPFFGKGFVRPRNDVLQADETNKGISVTLGIDEDGLLKPEATVSSRTESISGTSQHTDALSRTSPRIGIDAPLFDAVEENYVALNSEAHSLHTDRNVGQRIVLENAFRRESNSTSYAFTTPSGFTRTVSYGSPSIAFLRFSHSNPFRSYGGDYILESKSFGGIFDDTGWGRNNIASPSKSSSPYQNATKNKNTQQNNSVDSSVKFLLRPIRLLDYKHIEIYRMHDALHTSSPQYTLSYNTATSGGKYGLFNYEATPVSSSLYVGGTSGANTNGPYYPVVLFNNDSFASTISTGPTLPTSQGSTFTTDVTQSVTRLVTTENTLQHHRSDSVRNGDFSVKPRFSQSLHPKGHKGDVDFSTDDHSGDA